MSARRSLPCRRAVIQAGGRGLRLRPRTDTLPKPLIPVAGVPLVERMLRALAAGGMRRITVVVGHLGGQIERHLGALSDLPSDLRLDFHHETDPLGTIGALSALDSGQDPLLWVNGDLLTDIDFADFIRVHSEGGADLTLASHHETHRLRLGELVVADDGRVIDYREKPEKRYLICSGMLLMEPALRGLLEPGRAAGLPDLVRCAVRAGLRVRHWEHGAFWMDVNSPEELEWAEKAWPARGAASEK